MKSIDKTFSLFDFCKKKASKVQIYGEETLDDDGNIISFIESGSSYNPLFTIERF